MLHLLTAGNQILAQAAAPGPMEQLISMVVPLGIIFFIFYVLIWRPQSKQRSEHEAVLSALKVDDEVVTNGGILGRIKSIDDSIVTLEISKGTKMQVLRRNILGKQAGVVGGAKEDDKKEDKD